MAAPSLLNVAEDVTGPGKGRGKGKAKSKNKGRGPTSTDPLPPPGSGQPEGEINQARVKTVDQRAKTAPSSQHINLVELEVVTVDPTISTSKKN